LYLAGLIGAINIPFYEELALKTHWWAYSGCAMLLHTPYFIILGEFFIAMVFAVCCRFVDTKRWSETIGAGFMGGIFILLCYAFAFSLIEAAGL